MKREGLLALGLLSMASTQGSRASAVAVTSAPLARGPHSRGDPVLFRSRLPPSVRLTSAPPPADHACPAQSVRAQGPQAPRRGSSVRSAACFSPALPVAPGTRLSGIIAMLAGSGALCSAPARRAFELAPLRGGAHGMAADIGPLKAKRLCSASKLPERSSAGAVGYDLYSSEDAVVSARGSALVSTGIALAIPSGCYGRIAPRSGLAVRSSIDVGAGVIDPDYRGEVKVLLFNLGDCDFEAKAGTRIAQLIIERCETPPVVEVDSLDDTERGAGGFGSTGV